MYCKMYIQCIMNRWKKADRHIIKQLYRKHIRNCLMAGDLTDWTEYWCSYLIYLISRGRHFIYSAYTQLVLRLQFAKVRLFK